MVLNISNIPCFSVCTSLICMWERAPRHNGEVTEECKKCLNGVNIGRKDPTCSQIFTSFAFIAGWILSRIQSAVVHVTLTEPWMRLYWRGRVPDIKVWRWKRLHGEKSQGESRLLADFSRVNISSLSSSCQTRVNTERRCQHQKITNFLKWAYLQVAGLFFYTILRSDGEVEGDVISISFPFTAVAFDEEAVDAALADRTKITTLRSLFFTEQTAHFACWCRDLKVHTVFRLEMALSLFILYFLPQCNTLQSILTSAA